MYTKKTQKYECTCPCHKETRYHRRPSCTCGRPIRPPQEECCEYEDVSQPCGPECPEPEAPCQPGTVDVPQPEVPPKVIITPIPPWGVGKPPPGDPGEVGWFQGLVNGTGRKGPQFGPRKDEFLPYLLVRSASADRGARPFSGVFWESPDISVAPNVDPSSAPLFPPTSGGVAQSSVPNTLYAHVWNLGKSPAYRVRVEFYWFNPSLGISRSDANLVGAAWIDLANRYTVYPQWTQMSGPSGAYLSRGSHAIVKCPETWVPSYENNGHECLVVRAFEPIFDAVSPDQFSAAADRHIGQRNIAVVLAASPASIDLPLSLGYIPNPAEATVDVELAGPQTMEFLRQYTGKMDPGLAAPAGGVVTGLLPPALAGTHLVHIAGLPHDLRGTLLNGVEKFERGCDPLQIGVHASIQNIGPKEAQVIRVRQRIDGDVVGGYSLVLMGH